MFYTRHMAEVKDHYARRVLQKNRLSPAGGYIASGGSITGNLAPVVDAGADAAVTGVNHYILLGSATDDLLAPVALTYVWTVRSRPGGAPDPVFSAASLGHITVTVGVPGMYVFTLSVSDGSLSGSDDVAITFDTNKPPYVELGADTNVEGTLSAILNANVTDDGFPGASIVLWDYVSDAGTAAFDDATSLTPTVTVSDPGQYLFTCDAFDGELNGVGSVTYNFLG